MKTSQTQVSESPLSTTPQPCVQKSLSAPAEMSQIRGGGVSPKTHAPLGIMIKAEFVNTQPTFRRRSQRLEARVLGHPCLLWKHPEPTAL